MAGVYSINSPERLFLKLERSFTEFTQSPSEDGIFDVIFPLYHLREWICPGGWDSYGAKPEGARTPEERLHDHLHTMKEYQVVRALCNNAKHYADKDGLADRADVVHGATAGLARAGDSLGVTHFTVDGRDVRDYFWPVYQVYASYFKGEPVPTEAS